MNKVDVSKSIAIISVEISQKYQESVLFKVSKKKSEEVGIEGPDLKEFLVLSFLIRLNRCNIPNI